MQLLGTRPWRAGELAAAIGTSGPAMSRHLRVLLRAGLVADERPESDARARVFRLRPQSLLALQAWLDQLQARWDEQLAAFKRHIEEMNLWWVRGPINFFDSARAVAVVCEPGVGGRIIEVYDEATGEGLELARISAWHPGERLAWRSSVDDVEVEVRFEQSAAGTLVRVRAAIPAGGADRGGTAWVRVVPAWFGAWCARRDTAPREPRDLARLAVSVYYSRPAAAARWLADAFGFEPTNELPDAAADENWAAERRWIEFHLGNSALILFKLDGSPSRDVPFRLVPWVFVDDLDAHCARARAAGATIVTDIHSRGYRSYEADDLEGNRWTFAQARPTMR